MKEEEPRDQPGRGGEPRSGIHPPRDEAGREDGATPTRRPRKPVTKPASVGHAAPLFKSGKDDASMDQAEMMRLKEMHLAPYIQLSTALIGKRRRSGGNMFRHQIDTFGILLDFGYIDAILLKASVIHDLLEDLPDFDRDLLLGIDDEAVEVYKLVLEVTRRPVEIKPDFLRRIREYGSARAQVLKCADRISNMISLGYVTDVEFVRRYTDETEVEIFPIADHADPRMAAELRELVSTRRAIISLFPAAPGN